MSVLRDLRALSRTVRHAVIWAWGYVAFVISHIEAGRTVLSTEPGQGAPEQLGSRVVVFVHFDRKGEIRDHTRAYIDALRVAGLDVVFVTNAARLAPQDLAWVGERVARVMIRRNLGHDFAAWRDAMEAFGLPAANTSLLVLANDSVYGPLYPLGPVLDRIDFTKADVWSATDSWQHSFHLQSFLVAFGPKAFGHPAFKKFWRALRNVRSRNWVVREYEIGLSRAMIAAGLRCTAIWPYHTMIEAMRRNLAEDEISGIEAGNAAAPQVKFENLNGQRNIDSIIDEEDDLYNTRRILRSASRRIPLNPMADLWRVLIEQGCPFLKCELLRKNQHHVPNVAAWSSVVNEIDEFVHDAILYDLQKSLKNRSP
jgi:hypothetical protein